MDEKFLAACPLFSGIAAEEIPALMACLHAKKQAYGKGETILHAGDTARAMGLVLSGSVNIESSDVWGGVSLLAHILPGQLFSETYALVPQEPLMVDAVACEPTEVLFLSAERLSNPCEHVCGFHTRLIRNLLTICAQKNLRLSRRIFHTSPKTIRGRLLTYLSFEATKQNSRSFEIPFDRRQLADYLSVDRSALSAEIGKMQREGLLVAHKNRFELLRGESF